MSVSRFCFCFWKRAPFLKILPALIAGILLQWSFPLPPRFCWLVLGTGTGLLFLFFFIPLSRRHQFAVLTGISSALIFISTGAILSWRQDIRNNKTWVGYHYRKNDRFLVTLKEPLIEKAKSFKAEAELDGFLRGRERVPVKGRIILYFKKDSSEHYPERPVQYGQRILFKKPLQEIRNAGNPGGFDYKRYLLLRGITHQVFLKSTDYEPVPGPGKQKHWLKKIIYHWQKKVLIILKKNIPGEKEAGLSEALLIGYKNDLDPSLVQSYSRTGVVHIIAISGLHLGLIYGLLGWLVGPFRRFPKIKWMAPVLIIAGLWSFSLLAGAQPSVLRSAFMFSFMVLGEIFARKVSSLNSLAASAFLLLCINPFWLWDIGFQLSYAAVLSIIVFFRPVCNWFDFRNPLLRFFWKLNAVTFAAQVLTLPLCLYHFHQFPVFFILSNLVAVPLSSVILLGEILLCSISSMPSLAALLGALLNGLLKLMNACVEKVEQLPFSLWEGFQLNTLQTILLFTVIAGCAGWLLEKSITGLKLALFALIGFAGLRSLSFLRSQQQKMMIVYNIPGKKGVDFIRGRNYLFEGDHSLRGDDPVYNFQLRPSRILFRIKETDRLMGFSRLGNCITYCGEHVLRLEESISFLPQKNKPRIDLLLVSGKPRLDIKKLSGSLDIRRVIVDGSVMSWEKTGLKRDCDSLRIPFYDVVEKGAFVMSLR